MNEATLNDLGNFLVYENVWNLEKMVNTTANNGLELHSTLSLLRQSVSQTGHSKTKKNVEDITILDAGVSNYLNAQSNYY